MLPILASQFKEGRPRNLGRGVSKPKKNTVASLLAQSRAVGSKPLTAQQLLTQEAEIVSLLGTSLVSVSGYNEQFRLIFCRKNFAKQ